jgi:hypothetical protein
MQPTPGYDVPSEVPYAEREISYVVFRRWSKTEGGHGRLIALFPYEFDDHQGYKVNSYEHVGQHASADYQAVISRTVALDLSVRKDSQDQKELTRELENELGYRVEPIQRMNARTREKAQRAYRTMLKKNGLVPASYWPEIILD